MMPEPLTLPLLHGVGLTGGDGVHGRQRVVGATANEGKVTPGSRFRGRGRENGVGL